MASFRDVNKKSRLQFYLFNNNNNNNYNNNNNNNNGEDPYLTPLVPYSDVDD